MHYSDFSPNDKITVLKQEFSAVIKSIFDTPEVLKTYVAQKFIDNAQSKSILNFVNRFNSKTCVCCRRFDPTKIKMVPIDPELEPLLDVARSNAEKKSY
jgi:hypothetical protein